MGLEPGDLEKTIYDALVSEEEEPIPRHRDIDGMDLVPANILLANAEQELILAELREFRLKEDVRKRPPNPEVDSRKFGTALCYVKIWLQEGGVVALLSAGAG